MLTPFLTVLPNEVDMSSPLMYGTPSSRVEGTPRSGVRGTPARQRPDLGSVRKAPQVDLHSEAVSGRSQELFRLFLVCHVYVAWKRPLGLNSSRQCKVNKDNKLKSH